RRPNAIDDQGWVVDAAEILAQQRITVPDFLEKAPIRHDFRDAGQPDLVMMIVEVAQLDARIGLDLGRLVVAAQVGDVDDEAIRPYRRYRPNARLIAVDGRQVGEAVCLDDRLRSRND